MIKLKGRLLNLDSVDVCNRKFAKDCRISFPDKIPVLYDFQRHASPIGNAEIFKDDHGLDCEVTLYDKNLIDECYVGGYYTNVKTHTEGSMRVIDSCKLVSMSIVPDEEVADKNLKIRRVMNND